MGTGDQPTGTGPSSDATQPASGRRPIKLRVQLGADIGRTYTMSGDALSIGRGQENDLVLDDPQVSRNHARLFWVDDELFVEDLGSTNGTLVNQRRISGRHALQPTETIAIGGTVFTVEGFSAPTTVGIPPVANAGSPRPASAPPPRPQSPAGPPSAGNTSTPWLVIGGIIGLLAVVALIVGVAWWIVSQQSAPGTPTVPEVVIRSPVTGSQVQIDEPVSVNATATDPNGVTSAELSVNGAVVDRQQSAAAEGQTSFPVSLSWIPTAEGSFTLEVRAFNSQGRPSAPTTVMITVVDDRPPTNTPLPVTEEAKVTATPGDTPVAITTADLNVREGPGQNYPVVALVGAGTQMEIVGKSPDDNWWQVVYPPGSDGRGWIYSPFTRASNTQDVPVVVTPIPPAPTPTTTVTTVTPTASPTFAPSPTPLPTSTLVPTPTPTDEFAPVVELTTNQTEINAGECVVLTWHIENVAAAYLSGGEFDNIGLTGPVGSHETCPPTTTSYVLWADTAAGRIEQSVTVTVGSDQQTVVIGPASVGGMVRQDGTVKSQVYVGDDASDQGMRGFVAFDMAELAGKEIVEARLDLSNYVQTGTPFGDLGKLYVEQVNWWPMLDSDDYSAPAQHELAVIEDAAALISTIDISDRVREQLGGGSTILPIRIRFELDSNHNQQDDFVDWGKARLIVIYR